MNTYRNPRGNLRRNHGRNSWGIPGETHEGISGGISVEMTRKILGIEEFPKKLREESLLESLLESSKKNLEEYPKELLKESPKEYPKESVWKFA